MVYFIQIGKNGPIKIGFSKNVGKRFGALQNGIPYELNMLIAVEGDRHLEKFFHQEFKQDRIKGEWFKPSQRLCKLIAGFMKQRFIDYEDKRFLEETIDRLGYCASNIFK